MIYHVLRCPSDEVSSLLGGLPIHTNGIRKSIYHSVNAYSIPSQPSHTGAQHGLTVSNEIHRAETKQGVENFVGMQACFLMFPSFPRCQSLDSSPFFEGQPQGGPEFQMATLLDSKNLNSAPQWRLVCPSFQMLALVF